MEYTDEQVEAVARLASMVYDPWALGEEALRLHREQDLTDEQIRVILEAEYDRSVSRSTIQCARETFEVFGHDRLDGFGFSHHQVAQIAAKIELDLRLRHNLTEDEIQEIRSAAKAILEGIEAEPGQKVTVSMVREAVGVSQGPAKPRSVAVDPRPEVPDVQQAEERSEAAPTFRASRPRGSTTRRRPSSARVKTKTRVTGVEIVEQVQEALVTATEDEKRKILLALVGVIEAVLSGLDPEVAERIQERMRAAEVVV